LPESFAALERSAEITLQAALTIVKPKSCGEAGTRPSSDLDTASEATSRDVCPAAKHYGTKRQNNGCYATLLIPVVIC